MGQRAGALACGHVCVCVCPCAHTCVPSTCSAGLLPSRLWFPASPLSPTLQRRALHKFSLHLVSVEF